MNRMTRDALDMLRGGYSVVSMETRDDSVFLVLKKEHSVPGESNDEWVREHLEKYGREPDLFDGV